MFGSTFNPSGGGFIPLVTNGLNATIPAVTVYNIAPLIPLGLSAIGFNCSIPAGISGTIKNLRIGINSFQPGDGGFRCETFYNNVTTTLLVDVLAGAAPGSYSNITDSFQVSDGGLFRFVITNFSPGFASAQIGSLSALLVY